MKPRQLALAVLVGMMLFATAVWLLRDLPERPESKVSTHDAASAPDAGDGAPSPARDAGASGPSCGARKSNPGTGSGNQT